MSGINLIIFGNFCLIGLSFFLIKLLFSDQQIGTLLYRDFNFAFFDFIKDVLVGCNINPRIASLPLKVSFKNVFFLQILISFSKKKITV